MKNLASILCVLLCISCFSSKKYELEDQQYHCMKEDYQSKENLNLDELILAFENKLIEQGFLEDHSSASLLKCLQSMAKEDGKPISISPALSKSMLVSQGYAQICIMDIQDSSLIANSRIAEVQKGIQNVFAEIETTGDINPQYIGEGLVKVFKQEDFDHPLYRLTAFLVVGFLAEFENQNRASLGRTNQMTPASISEEWQMRVLINKQNKIFVNDEEISFDDFTVKVDQLFARSRTESKQSKRIKDKGDYALGRAFISLANEKDTDYDFYLKAYKQLQSSYAKILNMVALEVFNQPFDQLNKDQQKSIKGLQPWMVSESEPVNH